MVLVGQGEIMAPLRFHELGWPNRAGFLAGLVLVALSFWVPRAALLHGGGGALIGFVFMFVALSRYCNWSIAVSSLTSTAVCLMGGFGYYQFFNVQQLCSIIGLILAVVVLFLYLIQRARHGKHEAITKA